jgi:hypothetical protein
MSAAAENFPFCTIEVKPLVFPIVQRFLRYRVPILAILDPIKYCFLISSAAKRNLASSPTSLAAPSRMSGAFLAKPTLPITLSDASGRLSHQSLPSLKHKAAGLPLTLATSSYIATFAGGAVCLRKCVCMRTDVAIVRSDRTHCKSVFVSMESFWSVRFKGTHSMSARGRRMMMIMIMMMLMMRMRMRRTMMMI